MERDSKTGGIQWAFALNIIFAIFELIGGFLTNSVAILSDAVHDFGDSAAIGLSWYLQRVSVKRADTKYTYGYKRYSILGSLFISVVLIVSSIYIISESVKRVISPQEVNSGGMLLMAIAGILINGIAVIRLKGGSSLNERAVYLHLLEDVLGWIAVLIGAIVLRFVDFPIIDPLLSIGITIWILFNVFRNIKEALKILMQEAPQGVNTDSIEQKILTIKNISSIHDLHLWTLDGESHILTLHVVTDQACYSSSETEELKTDIRDLCEKEGISHVTIEIEARGERCLLESY